MKINKYKKNKGIALIITLLIVALMTIVASNMSYRLNLDIKKAYNLNISNQVRWFAISGEELIKKILKNQIKTNESVHLGQIWASENISYPIESGEISGLIRDMRSCFNLNFLSKVDIEKYEESIAALRFDYLLEYLNIDEITNENLTEEIIRWTGKFEVPYYQSLKFPYQNSKQIFYHASEIRAIKGVTQEVYRRLRPYICAYSSTEHYFNVNTIKEEQHELFAAIFIDDISPNDSLEIIKNRPENGWDTIDEFYNSIHNNLNNKHRYQNTTKVSSDTFMAYMTADYQRIRIKVESLFEKKSNRFVVSQRQFGSNQ